MGEFLAIKQFVLKMKHCEINCVVFLFLPFVLMYVLLNALVTLPSKPTSGSLWVNVLTDDFCSVSSIFPIVWYAVLHLNRRYFK